MNEEIDMMAGRFLRLSDCVKVYKNPSFSPRPPTMQIPEGFKDDVIAGMIKVDLSRKYNIGEKSAGRLYEEAIEEHLSKTGNNEAELRARLKAKHSERKSELAVEGNKKRGNDERYKHVHIYR